MGTLPNIPDNSIHATTGSRICFDQIQLMLDAYKTLETPFPTGGRPLSKGLSQGGGFVVKLEPYLPAKPLGEGRRFHFAQYI